MEKWVAYAFGEKGAAGERQLRRALDYLIGEEMLSVIRLFPSIRPYQLRRLCLFLAGLSDKEVAAVTGEDLPAVRVARWRFRQKLSFAGPEGWRMAEKIGRRAEKGE